MSNLTQAERDKLPLSKFGDPVNRNFPIVDASDVMAAAHLIGKAPAARRAAIKQRIIRIARMNNWPTPAAWQ